MGDPDFTVAWTWRSREPANSPPNPAYPKGMVVWVADKEARSCAVPLPYPAPGVGTWALTCNECGYTAAVTAAGRADDPFRVVLPCRRKADA